MKKAFFTGGWGCPLTAVPAKKCNMSLKLNGIEKWALIERHSLFFLSKMQLLCSRPDTSVWSQADGGPMATANYDPHLGAGPSEDSEILLDDSDAGSVLSDDSVLPDYDTDDNPTEPAKTLYEACTKNDPKSLRRILERGVTKEEAMELDINGRVRWILLSLWTNSNGKA